LVRGKKFQKTRIMHNYAKIHNFSKWEKPGVQGATASAGIQLPLNRPSYPLSGGRVCEARWSNLMQMAGQASILADNFSVEFINYIIAKSDIAIRHAFFWRACGLARCLSRVNTIFIVHSASATANQCQCIEVDDRDEVGVAI